jgi:D-alanine-D-alanine ligase
VFYVNDPHAREQTIRTREAVCRALQDLGHTITVVEAGPLLLERLSQVAPDVIFNLATGYRSKKDQANIVAMLEISGIPFTGSASHAHILGLHKHLSKMIMSLYGVPTPKFVIVHDGRTLAAELERGLRFPLIVKPSAEGSSAGISVSSVVMDPESAASQVDKVLNQFGPPVLVEEFVTGREFTVGLVGYPEPMVLPVEEIVFRKGGFNTYDVKSRDAVEPVCPAEVAPECALVLEDLAVKTFHAIDCLDIARVDIRVSTEGKPYVLEINTLPGLMPGYSEIPRMAEKAGITYAGLLRRVLEGAFSRQSQQVEALSSGEGMASWPRG